MKSEMFFWDERKNLINQKKHGISFEEAQTVFYDEQARLIHDPDHSEKEERFILLGMSVHFKVLVVCHCDLNQEGIIRIFSARKATSKERKKYEELLT